MEDIFLNVEKILAPFLKEKEITLYEVKFVREFGFKILRVLVDKKGGIDVDDLSLINEYLSERINDDDIEGEYMLEVSSPGAEKPLRNDEEIKNAIGEYVHIKTKEAEFEGYLLDYDLEKLTMKINVKGRIKEIIVNKDEVKKIRLAIKF